MAGEESWEKPYTDAIQVVRKGDFDEVKKVLEALGFGLSQKGDPNHFRYFHPLLRGDPHFAYSRNLYRPHGTRRSSDRISRHDQSQAKQMIEALRAVVGSSQEKSGDEQ